jgi:hypothetical protein
MGIEDRNMANKHSNSDGRIDGKTIVTAWTDNIKVAVTPEYIKHLEAKVRYVEMERDEARDVINAMAGETNDRV